jgi:hypothetical protein
LRGYYDIAQQPALHIADVMLSVRRCFAAVWLKAFDAHRLQSLLRGMAWALFSALDVMGSKEPDDFVSLLRVGRLEYAASLAQGCTRMQQHQRHTGLAQQAGVMWL